MVEEEEEKEEEEGLIEDVRRHAHLAVAWSRHVVSVRASLLLVRASLRYGFVTPPATRSSWSFDCG